MNIKFLVAYFLYDHQDGAQSGKTICHQDIMSEVLQSGILCPTKWNTFLVAWKFCYHVEPEGSVERHWQSETYVLKEVSFHISQIPCELAWLNPCLYCDRLATYTLIHDTA